MILLLEMSYKIIHGKEGPNCDSTLLSLISQLDQLLAITACHCYAYIKYFAWEDQREKECYTVKNVVCYLTLRSANDTVIRVVNTTQCHMIHQLVWYAQFVFYSVYSYSIKLQ